MVRLALARGRRVAMTATKDQRFQRTLCLYHYPCKADACSETQMSCFGSPADHCKTRSSLCCAGPDGIFAALALHLYHATAGLKVEYLPNTVYGPRTVEALNLQVGHLPQPRTLLGAVVWSPVEAFLLMPALCPDTSAHPPGLLQGDEAVYLLDFAGPPGFAQAAARSAQRCARPLLSSLVLAALAATQFRDGVPSRDAQQPLNAAKLVETHSASQRSSCHSWAVACRVCVLDHHKTSAAELTDPKVLSTANLEVHFDMQRSGATVAYDYFQPQVRSPAA